MAVVVLPTPPFWVSMARMRQALAGTGEPLHLEYATARIAAAWNHVAGETPSLARLVDLGRHAFALQEQALAAAGKAGAREAEQPGQRRDGAGGDDVGLDGGVLGAGV